MLRSMTGFGTAAVEIDGAACTAELRSVNNKYFKATIRVPEELAVLEAELESLLSRRLSRGSAVLTIRFVDESAAAAGRVNTAAIHNYLQQLLAVPGLDHAAARIDLGALLALPGVIIGAVDGDRLERARSIVMRTTSEACDRLLLMREREGEGLHALLHQQREYIAGRLAEIAARAPRVVEAYQERLRARINALLAEAGAAVRDEDLLREVAVYAERSDIAEEVSRLGSHLEQFREIIDDSAAEPAGRTLDFLAQEMLREANTIASKSSDAEISRRVVEIKGAIDRVKEQAANVE
jgi:uncharacterized protein (TIGR00255 family)